MPPSARRRPSVKATETAEPITTSEGKSSDRPKVYYEKSLTKNLGDYNSVKITVGVSLPADPTPEELKAVNRTIEIANSILDPELEKQILSVTED